MATGGPQAMAKNPLAELLRRALLDAEASSLEVRIRHRGAPDDVLVLGGDEVVRVGADHLELADLTRIPLHRVLSVRFGDRTLWEKPAASAKRGTRGKSATRGTREKSAMRATRGPTGSAE